MRKGAAFKSQPKRLRAFVRRLGRVASSVQPPTFESEMAAAVSGPGGLALLSQLDPLDLALLLAPDEVIDLHLPGSQNAMTGYGARLQARQGAKQEGDGLSNWEQLKVLWRWPRTGIAILKQRGQMWWDSHREQAKKHLNKALTRWLLNEVGLGWVLPVQRFIEKHAPELQKKFDPTEHFPPEMKPEPHSTVGGQCQVAATAGNGAYARSAMFHFGSGEDTEKGASAAAQSADCGGEDNGGTPEEETGGGQLHWTGTIGYEAAIANQLGEFEDGGHSWYWHYSGAAEATWNVDSRTPVDGVDPYEDSLGGSEDEFFRLDYTGQWAFTLEEDYYFCNGPVDDRHLQRAGHGAGAAAPNGGRYFEEVGVYISPRAPTYDLWLGSAPLGEESITGMACAPLPEHRDEVRWDHSGSPPYFPMPTLTPSACYVLDGGAVYGLDPTAATSAERWTAIAALCIGT